MAGRVPKYSQEFQAEAVRMVEQDGRPITEVARHLKIPRRTLANWVQPSRRAHADHEQPSTPAVRARVVEELKNEVRSLRGENEFLRRVVAYFAGGQP